LEEKNVDGDVYAINHNYIAITPLNIDRTDLIAYKEIVASVAQKNKK